MSAGKQCLKEPTNNTHTLPEKEIEIERAAIRLLIGGDQQAFTDLYNIYAEKIFYFSLKFLKTVEDAENLTQEVFVKIWETRERLNPDNSFNAYIFTITRNAIFNIHRKKMNEIAYLDQLSEVFDYSESRTEKDFHFNELRAQIDQCVEKLPNMRQKVFILSRFDGLSHKEISQKLGIAEKTIATHIRLALQSLRACLGVESGK